MRVIRGPWAGRPPSGSSSRRPAAVAAALWFLAVPAIGALALMVRPQEPAARLPTSLDALAVLPFQAGGGKERGLCSLALPETLAARLSPIPGLEVRPMSGVLRAGIDGTDPARAGTALGVQAVLSGRCWEEHDRLHAEATLIDVETGYAAWSRSFSSRGQPAEAFREEVALQVAEALFPGAGPRPGAKEEAKAGPAAEYLFLLARGKIASSQSSLTLETIDLLERALRESPHAPVLSAALAEASLNVYLAGHSPDTAWLVRAEGLARRAIHLGPDEAAGHYALARILYMSGSPIESSRRVLLALERDPRMAPAYRLLAVLASGAGDPRPVRALRQKVAGADPSLDAGWVDTVLALQEGTVEETRARLRDDISRLRRRGEPTELPLMHLGFLAAEAGDSAEALHVASSLAEASANAPYAETLRVRAMAAMNDAAGVQRVVERNRDFFVNDHEYALWVGRAMAMVGRDDEALEWIQRAVRLGSSDLWSLTNEPGLRRLNADPRFRQAVAEVRLRAETILELVRAAGYG
ncbi:MAG TPA: hypothetical protein VJV23_08455 [Candidatus Polarisedimenticolia bacterium]|nr:hypothetical protein [Candidatus Polarisedimenticolia bacterium]